MQRSRLSDALVTTIAAEILTGDVAAEALLPPEPQLCERFQVSRTVVREAIARLRRIGLVRVRQGWGTIVLPRAHWHEFDPELIAIRAETGQITDLIPHLLEIRRMVEIEAAGVATQRRRDADLTALRAYLAEMERALDNPVTYNDADIAFHDALITATQNELMHHMMRPINQLRRIGSSITTARSQASIDRSMAGHRSILAAVEQQDAARAREVMAEHIAQFEQDLAQTFHAFNGRAARIQAEAVP